jgi:predicted nucleic acid-binding protein
LGGRRSQAGREVMRWVSDTGPLLHLAEAGAADLLQSLGEVLLPAVVQSEWSRYKPVSDLPRTLRVVSLSASAEAVASDWCKAGLVHRGEAHAIALAQELKADYLLTDDSAARLLATTLGLKARGSLGVILWLAGQRRLSPVAAEEHLERLAGTSLWISPRVLREADIALKQITGR